MSWISPAFGDGGDLSATPPPNKRHKRGAHASFESVESSAPGGCDWLQKYRPKSVADLAVNAKKVQEVECWLADGRSKLLLLSGPAGCGKTTTLLTLCRSLGVRVTEWITPPDKPDEHWEHSTSGAKKFDEYLLRSSRYGSCLASASASKRIVLVKDFPNAFLHDPSAFHESLGAFAAKCVNPVAFVCGDDALCRKLFPADVKRDCGVRTVAFNPVTDRRTFGVLKSVLARESRIDKNLRAPTDDAVDALSTSCRGDLRSAITTLYFLSVHSDLDVSRAKTRGKSKRASSPDESEPIKDNRLDFFRGVGRVLFPKRIETPGRLELARSSEGIVDNFVGECDGFVNRLHENYPSKVGPDVAALAAAADRLATSDVLLARWQDRDAFREHALAVAVKGLMVCNRRPRKGGFEPFRRGASAASRCRLDAEALRLEGKALFSHLQILDCAALVDVLPFAAALLPGLNPSQLNYIQRTCRYKSV